MATSQVSSKPSAAIIPSSADAATYESSHVHDVYSQIAPHFAATRHAPWPRVNQFLSSLPASSLVADIGCGNGKYMAVLNELSHYGIATDFCAPLIEYAHSRFRPGARRYDTAIADSLKLPFRAGLFDAAVNIAVIHHFCTTERRVEAIREMMRVLKVGGLALIYVWAIERPHKLEPKHGNRGANMLNRRFETQDVFVPWHMRSKKEGAANDKILGDWHDVHHRFYHVYRKGELEDEVDEVKNVTIVESYYDHQNWCCILRKEANGKE